MRRFIVNLLKSRLFKFTIELTLPLLMLIFFIWVPALMVKEGRGIVAAVMVVAIAWFMCGTIALAIYRLHGLARCYNPLVTSLSVFFGFVSLVAALDFLVEEFVKRIDDSGL